MPLTAKTPREIFHAVQDHLNRVLNTVLTHYRLEFTVHHLKQGRTFLHFRDEQKQAMAVPLLPSPWRLYIGQGLQAVPEGKEYTIKVLQYAYRIQRSPSIQDEAEVRFEYVSHEIDPSARWCRHHVQFHREYQGVRVDFSPNKLHIPTGVVTLESVLRFLIADLGVPPLTDRWETELQASEARTREWIG